MGSGAHRQGREGPPLHLQVPRPGAQQVLRKEAPQVRLRPDDLRNARHGCAYFCVVLCEWAPANPDIDVLPCPAARSSPTRRTSRRRPRRRRRRRTTRRLGKTSSRLTRTARSLRWASTGESRLSPLHAHLLTTPRAASSSTKLVRALSLTLSSLADLLLLAEYIRNKATKVSRAVTRIDALYRWALTGTPVTNSLADLYPLFRFLQLKP